MALPLRLGQPMRPRTGKIPSHMKKMTMKNSCILSTLFAFATSLIAGITPTHLQCEYQTNPLAVDQLNPVLSWQLTADRPAEIQTAYRILVASSSELFTSASVAFARI